MEEERTIEYTDIQLKFLDLIKKYPVKSPETVVDYVSSQGETVLEEPTELAKALSECEITPVRRRQILKHWFASQGVEVPEPVLKQATLSTENRESVAEGEARKGEKYSVDTNTGDIKVATTTDKNPLTWDEAEKLSTQIKKDIEAREKKEAKGEKGDKEPPFTIDSEGNWQLNPKARIGGMELLAFEAVRKSAERGEPLDPFELMKERAKDIETMRSVFGGGGGGGGLSELTDTLLKLKQLTGADEDTKKLLFGMFKKLDEIGEGKGESEEVSGLRQDLQALRAELEKKDREALMDKIEGFKNELSNVRAELAKTTGEARAQDEYGIMSQGLGVIDKRLSSIEGVIRGVFGRAPGVLPPGRKKELTEAITAEVVEEGRIDELAHEVFG